MNQSINNLSLNNKSSIQAWPISQWLVIIGLWLTVVSLPLLDWQFFIWGLEFNISDFLILITAFIYIFDRIFAKLAGVKTRPWQWPLAGPAILFLVVVLFSALLSPWPVMALKYSLRIIVFAYLLYVVLPVNILDSWSKWLVVAWGVVVAGFYSSVIGLWSLTQQDLTDTFFRVQPIALWGQWWLGSNHNLLAEFLVISNFFLIAVSRLSKSQQWQKIANVLFIFLTLVVLLTFSRAAWIVVISQLALWWLTISDRRQKVGWLIGFLVVAALAIPLWLRMDSLQTANFSSTENRVLLTKIAWNGFKSRPLLGYGGGQFLQLVDSNLRFVAKYGDPIDSHGVLQKITAENGLLGLLSMALLVTGLLFTWWQAWSKNPQAQAWLVPLILAAGGGLVFQIFNTSYYKGKVWLPVALSLAAIRLLYEQKKSPNTD